MWTLENWKIGRWGEDHVVDGEAEEETKAEASRELEAGNYRNGLDKI